MKKVMCINDNWHPDPKYKNSARPSFGDIDIVTDEGFINGDMPAYTLERFGNDAGFAQRNFAPCSEIEEQQLEYSKMQIS
jgi:hypothetical protein